MNNTEKHTARCFCGAVELELDGAPEAMGYCHCESCRHWSAGPVNAFTLWPNPAVRIAKGEERLGRYAKTPASVRRWCMNCGGHVLTEHPAWGLVDVYAAIIEDFDFRPGVHVHYQETVLPIPDGVTKLRDLPDAMGGSGVALAE
ncbi:MAG TPA: GFA family protein [Rhodanobacteraceae bacterium]|nr:GFA family protein [Rhodanobacteraceae bacterium]